jgi:ATP-dependent exoDNAse (exonuclease V) beta subunit
MESLSLPTSDSIDPRDLGSFVHAALERLALVEKPQVDSLCEQLAVQRVLFHHQRTAATTSEMLSRFIQTPRWTEIVAARTVRRELEFLLAWPPEPAAGDGTYIQGYFDCLYQDTQGGWHLVDYKTNDISACDAAREAARYEMQMLLYALAAECALGVGPVELVLHFLRPGIEHVFRWDEAARQRSIELVDEAMRDTAALYA